MDILKGSQVAAAFNELGVSHVVWLPDSALGPWEQAIEADPQLNLVRVCREGEAWAIAAGLYLGGARPLVMIQNTGLFESGDALRNVLFDLGLPLWAVIGYRSYFIENSPDTARKFTEPILAAWGIETALLTEPDSAPQMVAHFRKVEAEGRPGVVLIAEGRM